MGIKELFVELKQLLTEEPLILASPEDADFFRKKFKKHPAPLSSKEVSPVLPIAHPLPPPSLPQQTPPPPIKTAPSEPVVEKFDTPPPPRTKTLDFSPLQMILEKVAPGFPILREIPSDAIAKKIATRWKTKNQTAPISILSYGEPAPQKALLEELAKALDVYFGPARLIAAEPIEKEKQWDAFLSVAELKHVVVCDFTLWQLNHLMRHYKENTAQGTRTLGAKPLFLLPDLSLYLKDPLLKRFLWKSLCQTVAS